MDQIREMRLVGWKRIAAHLGCSERTARRWEREEGLPIHRQQHAAKSTVYARPEELQTWLASRADGPSESPNASEPRAPGILAAAVGLIAIVFLGGLGWTMFLSGPDETKMASKDPVAVELYERGRALWLERGKEPNTRAVKLLEEAVSRDANYAEAWQALASAWMTLPTYSDEVIPQSAFNEALFAADRAISLNPSLVEARTVMAALAERRGDWLAAKDIFEDAIAQDPDNPMMIVWLAEHYRDLGYIDTYRLKAREAAAIAPNSPPVRMALALGAQIEPNPQQGQDQLLALWNDTGFETPPIWFAIWHIFVRLEDFESAERWIAKSPAPVNEALLTGFLQAKESGETDQVEPMIGRIVEAYENGLPGWFAYTLLDHLGAPETGLRIADREGDSGRFELSIVMFDPMFPAGRQTQQFERVATKLGFVEYWKVNGAPDFCSETPLPPICAELMP